MVGEVLEIIQRRMRVSLYTGRHFKPAEVERVSEHPRCPRTLETRLLNAGDNFSVVTSSRITKHAHFRAKQFLQHPLRVPHFSGQFLLL